MKQTNEQTNKKFTKLKFIALLVTFLSLFSINSHSQEIDIEINAGCDPIIVALMYHPGFRIGASAQYVWAAGISVGTVAGVNQYICDNLEEAIEDHVQSWRDFDTEKFLDENCNGEYGRCDDPLLDVTGCGMFNTCPQSPYDCEFNTLRCIDNMLNLSDGYTMNEVINATIYIHSSFHQGYWHHNMSDNNDISFDIK